MLKQSLLVILLGLTATAAYADTPPAPPSGASADVASRHAHMKNMMQMNNCTMQENVSLNVSFNFKAASFMEAKNKFDEKMKDVDNYAKDQHVEKFDMQSMNYNINAQQVSYEDGVAVAGAFVLSGNTSYRLDSADNAFKLGEYLTKQKLQVSVNVNSNRVGVCNSN